MHNDTLNEQTPMKIDRKVTFGENGGFKGLKRMMKMHKHIHRETGDEFIKAKLMSQYFHFQDEVNDYIRGEYNTGTEVKPLETPHELYRIRKLDDPSSEITISPQEIMTQFSPDSKYVAVMGKGHFELYELSDFKDAANIHPQTKIRNIFLHAHERVAFSPDSNMLLIYSCFSFKLIDIKSNELIYHQTLDHLISNYQLNLPTATTDPEFNIKMCFGQYYWQVTEDDNFTNFVFFSPLFIYSFEMRSLEAMRSHTPAVAIHMISSSTGRSMSINGCPDNLRYCGGGRSSVYALERAADDSVIVWKGVYNLKQEMVKKLEVFGESNLIMGEASIHFEQLPASFDFNFDDIRLSTITRESNIGIDVKDGSKSKIFYDSKCHQVAFVHYQPSSCDIQKVFYLESDPRLVEAFDNCKVIAVVGHDSFLNLWIVDENKIINVLRSYVDKCISISVTPDNKKLLIISETDKQSPAWKLEFVPVELQNYSIAEQLCFDYSRRFDEADFLQFNQEYVQFLEDGHLIIRRHFDHRDDIIIDILEHPVYNPNLLEKRWIAESPYADLQKRYYLEVTSYSKCDYGLIAHIFVEDRSESITGVLVQSYTYNSLKRATLLDTIGIDRQFEGYTHFSANFDLTASYIAFENSIYRRILGEIEVPYDPVVSKDIFHKRWQKSFFKTLSGKAKQRDSMGSFFEFLNREYVDCSTIKGKTHLAITNLNRELKSESYFEEKVSITNVCISDKEYLYCLYGDDGIVLVNRAKESFFWYKTPNHVKKIALKASRIDKVKFTPSGKYVVISIRSEDVRYFVSLKVDTMTIEDMLIDKNVSEDDDAYWVFSDSSFYWIYANGYSRLIEIFNIELQKSIYKIQMNNKMAIQNLRIDNGTLIISGLLSYEKEQEPIIISHTIFQYKIPLKPEGNSLMPLIQHQMVKYFTTDYSEIKDICAENINSLLRASNHYIVKMNSIFTIIMFMLNNATAFKKFTQVYQPIEIMLENHKLIRLFFKTNKPDSNSLTVELIDQFLEENHDYPFLDEDFIHQQIREASKSFMRNSASQLMMRRLLFSPVGDTPAITLKSNWRAMKKLRPDQEDNIKSNVVIDTYEKLSKEEVRNPKSYSCFETKIKLDLTNGSNFSMAFFEMLQKCSDSDLIERYKVMIYYKWSKIYFFALFYCMAFWTMTTLYYVYFGFPYSFGYWGSVLILLTIAFLIFELKCASSNFKKYLSDFWNLFDLIILGKGIVITFVMLYHQRANLIERDNMSLNWFRSIVVFGMCVRSLTLLRVFSMTRYLISMILRVFTNLTPFVVIIISLIVTYAYLWMMIPFLSPNEDDGSDYSFYASIEAPINIIFGNSDPLDTSLGPLKFIAVMVGNTVFALTMVNFLIAIITATFDNVSNKRDIHDVNELLSLIRVFDAFFNGLRSPNKQAHYYLTLIEKEDTADHIQVLMDKQAIVSQEVRYVADVFGKKFDALAQIVENQNIMLKELTSTITNHAKGFRQSNSGESFGRGDSMGFEALVAENSPENIEVSEEVEEKLPPVASKKPIGPRSLHRKF